MEPHERRRRSSALSLLLCTHRQHNTQCVTLMANVWLVLCCSRLLPPSLPTTPSPGDSCNQVKNIIDADDDDTGRGRQMWLCVDQGGRNFIDEDGSLLLCHHRQQRPTGKEEKKKKKRRTLDTEERTKYTTDYYNLQQQQQEEKKKRLGIVYKDNIIMALKRTEGKGEGGERVNKKKILKRKRVLMAVVHHRPPRKETKFRTYIFKLYVNECSEWKQSSNNQEKEEDNKNGKMQSE